MPIKSRIRTIPDYPKPGIMFRDITTLLGDAEGARIAVDRLATPFQNEQIDKVAGVEARGFIFGLAVALQLGTGFVPVRKQGKLPGETLGQDYELEYGRDRIEVHVDAFQRGERVLLVDDLIATGGTMEAAANLIQAAGGEIVACAFVVELPDLGGRRRLETLGHKVFSLCEFAGE